MWSDVLSACWQYVCAAWMWCWNRVPWIAAAIAALVLALVVYLAIEFFVPLVIAGLVTVLLVWIINVLLR